MTEQPCTWRIKTHIEKANHIILYKKIPCSPNCAQCPSSPQATAQNDAPTRCLPAGGGGRQPEPSRKCTDVSTLSWLPAVFGLHGSACDGRCWPSAPLAERRCAAPEGGALRGWLDPREDAGLSLGQHRCNAVFALHCEYP